MSGRASSGGALADVVVRAVSAELVPPLPAPLVRPVADNHTHLDHSRRGEDHLDAAAALDLAASVGVDRVVQIGCDLQSAQWSVDLAQRDRRVLAGVALHPTEATRIHAESGARGLVEAIERIAEFAADPRVRVIGETGLDHYWVNADDVAGRKAQEDSFRAHIDLAKRLDAVLQIHDRDAHEDVVRILLEEGAPARTVFHCFSGGIDLARTCAERGWYASFAGPVTFSNAKELRQALHVLPVGQLLVETDAPYLAPHPLRGKRNTPALIPITVRRMASELGMDEATLCDHLSRTSDDLYGPW